MSSLALVKYWTTQGDIDQALTVARNSTVDKWHRGRSFQHIVQQLIPQDLDRAGSLAESIEDRDLAALAMLDVAQAWAALEQPNTAEDWVSAAYERSQSFGTRMAAAQVYVDTKNILEAGWAASQAINIVRRGRILGWPDQQEALKSLADPLAGIAGVVGETRVRKMITALPESRQRAWTLGWVATRLAQSGLDAIGVKMAQGAFTLIQDHRQAEIWRAVAKATGGALKFNQVTELISTQVPESFQVEVLIGVATTWASRDDSGDLLKIIGEILVQIETPESGLPLTALAQGFAELGQVEAVMALIPALQDGRDDNVTWAKLAHTLAEAGCFDAAQELIYRIDHPVKAIEAQVHVVSALWQSDHLTEAQDLRNQTMVAAQSLENEEQRANALISVCESLAQGSHPQTIELAQQALQSALSISNRWQQADLIGRSAQVFAQLGNDQAALDVVRQIRDRYHRDSKLEALVATCAERGDLELAEQVAAHIESTTSQAAAWVHIAGYLDRIGKSQAARDRTASAIEQIMQSKFLDKGDVRDFVNVLANYRMVENNLQELVAVALELSFPEDRAEALVSIATALADLGNPDQARTIARQAYDVAPKPYHIYGRFDAPASVARSNQAETMGKIAFILARVADFDLAQAVVGHVEKAKWRDYVIKQMTLGMIQAGAINLALVKATKIETMWQHVNTLTAAVKYCVENHDTEQALGTWRRALDTARQAGRAEVIQVIAAGVSLIGSLGGGAFLFEMYKALDEVESWWISTESDC